jgi:hypothetical protein
MADMDNDNGLFGHAIKDSVRISNKRHDPDVGSLGHRARFRAIPATGPGQN